MALMTGRSTAIEPAESPSRIGDDGRSSGSRPVSVLGESGKDDWPEPRPAVWRALARLDWSTGVSSWCGSRLDAILVYHSVGGIPGSDYRYDLSPAQFREQIRMLHGSFEPVDLAALIDVEGTDRTPNTDPSRKRVAITFDDAFRNVYDVAAPILREFDVPATVFACPDFLGDESVGLLRERHSLGSHAHGIAMTEAQLREIAAEELFTVGNHTASHPDLTALPDREAVVEEVVGAKRQLEERIGTDVDRFSYPHGAIDRRAAAVVADSHSLAVTSEPSLLGRTPDPYSLPRIDACQPIQVLRLETSDVGFRLKRAARRASALAE
jgi:peptidoglycan/xylan/chitin deacetylase (PgdA/CDA1 family)